MLFGIRNGLIIDVDSLLLDIRLTTKHNKINENSSNLNINVAITDADIFWATSPIPNTLCLISYLGNFKSCIILSVKKLPWEPEYNRIRQRINPPTLFLISTTDIGNKMALFIVYNIKYTLMRQ